MTTDLIDPDTVRKDFIPKDGYVSREFLEFENRYLWPRVWQMACREEEIPNPRDYLTYEVANETIVILRDEDGEIRAFHNVCPHRGRRLTSGCGRAEQLVCRFHGWRFALDGRCTHISDRDDWGRLLDYKDVGLKPVKVGTWGGFVFINMDLNAEPLERFLEPFNKLTERFEYEKLHYSWYRTSVAPCNWKIALEAFSEGYHVQQSHAQMLQYFQDYSESGAYGRHGAFWYPPPEGGASPFSPSFRLNRKPDPDARKYVVTFLKSQWDEIRSLVSERTRDVHERISAELDASTPPMEVAMKFSQFQREAAEADGAGWPEGLDPQYIDEARATWILFPNFIIVHAMIDCMLVYKARPNGDDPHTCLFDVWVTDTICTGKRAGTPAGVLRSHPQRRLGSYPETGLRTFWGRTARPTIVVLRRASPESGAGSCHLKLQSGSARVHRRRTPQGKHLNPTPERKGCSPMNAETIADRFFKAQASGNLSELDKLMRDDVHIWHNFDNKVQSKTQTLENLKALWKTSRLSFKFHHRLVTKDEFAVRYDTIVSTEGRDDYVTPTAMFFRVEGDQIISIHEYLDISNVKDLI